MAKAANLHGLPRTATEQQPAPPNSFVEQLKAHSAHGCLQLYEFNHRRQLNGRSVNDRGGRTNAFLEETGIPRWALVTECSRLFEIFKPGEMKATENGAFHEFCNAVFEYATGKEAEIHAKLSSWVKDIAKGYREERVLEAKSDKLDAKLDKLYARKYSAATEAATRETERQLGEVWDELSEVRQRTWPHLRFSYARYPKTW